jgi:hypothetical protein
MLRTGLKVMGGRRGELRVNLECLDDGRLIMGYRREMERRAGRAHGLELPKCQAGRLDITYRCPDIWKTFSDTSSPSSDTSDTFPTDGPKYPTIAHARCHPPGAVFAEGTISNGRVLLKFSRGCLAHVEVQVWCLVWCMDRVLQVCPPHSIPAPHH